MHLTKQCLGSSQPLNGSIVSTSATVWRRALHCSSLFCQLFLKISRHSKVCTKQMVTYPSPPDSKVCNQCSVLTFLRPFIHINAAMENWWKKKKKCKIKCCGLAHFTNVNDSGQLWDRVIAGSWALRREDKVRKNRKLFQTSDEIICALCYKFSSILKIHMDSY